MRIFLEELEALASDFSAGEESAMTEGFEVPVGLPEPAGRAVVSATEYTDLSKARKNLMVLAKSKRVRLHLCRHDEGLPCTIEDPFLSQSVTDSDGTEVVHTGKPGYRK